MSCEVVEWVRVLDLAVSLLVTIIYGWRWRACSPYGSGEPCRSWAKQMITIRFPDSETKRRALGFLAGRFSFTSWATGEVLVPDSALPALAHERISFTVEGPPTYGQAIPALRNACAPAVQ